MTLCLSTILVVHSLTTLMFLVNSPLVKSVRQTSNILAMEQNTSRIIRNKALFDLGILLQALKIKTSEKQSMTVLLPYLRRISNSSIV